MSSFKATEIGRTEVIYDTNDPDFVKTFKVDYHFEETQNVTIKVFDEDSKGELNLSKHDYIGTATLSLAQLMGSKGNTLSFKLAKGGNVIIRAE
jgi:hypothetical protein